MTVGELIARLRQPDVRPEWEVYLNLAGEAEDIDEVQVDADLEFVVLVP